MHIQTALQKGHFHPVYCEDFLLTQELSKHRWLAAVMDGCTMGDDSHFASTLTGKILKKIIKELGFEEFGGSFPSLDTIPLDQLTKEIVMRLLASLEQASNSLLLEESELLSTLVLSLVDQTQHKAFVLVIGDGYFASEGKVEDVDQNNKPDYLGYHLGENIESWWASQTQHWSLDSIASLTIATDGPGAIEKLDSSKPDFPGSVIDYLLLDESLDHLPRGLGKKLEQLENEHGLVATDDIAIIKMRW